MPRAVVNISWAYQNANRRYPLADDATPWDATNSFFLPDDFLLAIDLPIHAGMDVNPAQFFVLSVTAAGNGYLLVIGYQPAVGSPVQVASALIPRQGHTFGRTYTLGGIEPFDDTLGKVAIGKFDSIDAQPPGDWSFTLDATRLDPDAVRPKVNCVSAIQVRNGEQLSARLQGDIELVAGTNCQLVPYLPPPGDTLGLPAQIQINFLQGEGTIQTCVCEGDPASATPIRRISGLPGSPTGDFTLEGTGCLQIVPITNGLRLIDTCAQPCCGCPELEKITQDLLVLQQQASSVQSFAQQLQANVNAMSLIVLGSRLNDRSCVG